MVQVTKENAPQLCAAFRAIEEDNGGHLIGTVYPGEKIDLERFDVPEPWAYLIPYAEAGLSRLHSQSEDDWQTFVAGECSEAEAIEHRQGDLYNARRMLDDWFNGWQPEDQPDHSGRVVPHHGSGPDNQ